MNFRKDYDSEKKSIFSEFEAKLINFGLSYPDILSPQFTGPEIKLYTRAGGLTSIPKYMKDVGTKSTWPFYNLPHTVLSGTKVIAIATNYPVNRGSPDLLYICKFVFKDKTYYVPMSEEGLKFNENNKV